MKAIRNDVIVQKVEQETTTESGLIIQGHDHGQQQRVRVISVGDQVTDIAVDDVVVLDQHTRGRMFELAGEKYWVVKDTEVVAVYQ